MVTFGDLNEGDVLTYDDTLPCPRFVAEGGMCGAYDVVFHLAKENIEFFPYAVTCLACGDADEVDLQDESGEHLSLKSEVEIPTSGDGLW